MTAHTYVSVIYACFHWYSKAVVDYTLPALCTPITPSQPIRNDPFCSECGTDRMIPSAAWRYWRLNDLFCSEHLTVQCQWGGAKIAPSSWDFFTLQEEDWAMAIGNMCRGEDTVCGSRDILAYSQTDTQACLSQYFSATPAGKVKSVKKIHQET